MFSAEDLTRIEKAMASFGFGNKAKSKEGKNGGSSDKPEDPPSFNLTPPQILVIAGLLAGALEVDSVSVDRDQSIGISLRGTLRRKTPVEEFMQQIGQLPFDQVMKAIMYP